MASEKCRYIQTYEQTNPHFEKADKKHMTHQELRTIRFDDPDCMGTTIVDKMMINNVVSRWFLGTYVLKDAAFDTRNLRRPGKYEARGQCIQSKTYPPKAIAIEYLSEGDSITGVVYMPALGGCG